MSECSEISSGIKSAWFQNGKEQIIGMVVKTAESEEAGTEGAKKRQEVSEMAAPEWGSPNHGEEYFLIIAHHMLCDAEVV